MSTETITQRAIFASEEQNLLTPNRPPISRLAICSFILGMTSSISLFNLDLVALPILTAAIGLAAYLLIFRNDSVRGQNLALIGMGLSIAFGTACYVSTSQRDQYLFKEGASVAEQFLNVVAHNKLLEAFELTRSEPERQVAGTSLQSAYENATQQAKENIDGFKRQEGVQKVVLLGPSAKWKFHSGIHVLEVQGKSVHVAVRMIDEQSQKISELTLNRDLHLGIGSWYVVSVK